MLHILTNFESYIQTCECVKKGRMGFGALSALYIARFHSIRVFSYNVCINCSHLVYSLDKFIVFVYKIKLFQCLRALNRVDAIRILVHFTLMYHWFILCPLYIQNDSTLNFIYDFLHFTEFLLIFLIVTDLSIIKLIFHKFAFLLWLPTDDDVAVIAATIFTSL